MKSEQSHQLACDLRQCATAHCLRSQRSQMAACSGRQCNILYPSATLALRRALPPRSSSGSLSVRPVLSPPCPTLLLSPEKPLARLPQDAPLLDRHQGLASVEKQLLCVQLDLRSCSEEYERGKTESKAPWLSLLQFNRVSEQFKSMAITQQL